VISFGWSRSVEYCNGIERVGETLLVSLGVADCGSALLELPLDSITRLLRPLPASGRGGRGSRAVRVNASVVTSVASRGK